MIFNIITFDDNTGTQLTMLLIKNFLYQALERKKFE